MPVIAFLADTRLVFEACLERAVTLEPDLVLDLVINGGIQTVCPGLASTSIDFEFARSNVLLQKVEVAIGAQ